MTLEIERSKDRNAPLGDPTCWPEKPRLTRNQKMVYDALYGLGRTAKAYELLDILRPKGVKAAPTIYRALNELESKGLVQHVVSSRSFVALPRPQTALASNLTFVCEQCGETSWVESEGVISAIAENARASGFKVRTSCIEIETACRRCSSAAVE